VGELARIRPVMVAVVLDRQFAFLPPYVEEVLPLAIEAEDWDLRGRSRVTRANQQEPQPGFGR